MRKPFTKHFIDGHIWEDTSARKYKNKGDAESTAKFYRKQSPGKEYKVIYDYEENDYIIIRRRKND